MILPRNGYVYQGALNGLVQPIMALCRGGLLPMLPAEEVDLVVRSPPANYVEFRMLRRPVESAVVYGRLHCTI